MNKKLLILLATGGTALLLFSIAAIIANLSDPQTFRLDRDQYIEGWKGDSLYSVSKSSSWGFNNTFVGLEIQAVLNYLVYSTQDRNDAHIFTDKLIYRPNDTAFIEVYIVDYRNKTPVGMSKQDPGSNYYISIEVISSSGTTVNSSYSNVESGTAAFNWAIPDDISGGEYTLKVSSYNIGTATRVIRVRDYPRDELSITTSLTQDSYRPGDTISGSIIVETMDGSSFDSTLPLVFSYYVDFQSENSLIVEEANKTFSLVEGKVEAFFQITIPEDTLLDSTIISFSVSYGDLQQISSAVVLISQPSSAYIEFFSENGLISFGVPNKIYFQAWTGMDRSTVLDVKNANLNTLDTASSLPSSADRVLLKGINSAHKGKGSFIYKPELKDLPYLSLNLGNNQIVNIPVQVSGVQSELTYTITNANRVLLNNDNLTINFQTTEYYNTSDVYLFQLRYKEEILFSDQLMFKLNTSETYIVHATKFPVINGGLFTVALYRYTDSFYQNYTAELKAFQTNGYISYTQGSGSQSGSGGASPAVKAGGFLKAKSIIAGDSKQSVSDGSKPLVLTWFQSFGEINFFKRPASNLKISIKTENKSSSYLPGEQVTYTATVTILNSKGQYEEVKSDTYVSVTVTDDSVFKQIEDFRQPPSFAARVYLENEVQVGSNSEFLYANQYIEHWFGGSNSVSKDSFVELLLGVQGWRYRIFDYINVYQIQQDQYSLTDDERNVYSALFSFEFQNRQYMYEMAAGGVQDGIAASTTGGSGEDDKDAGKSDSQSEPVDPSLLEADPTTNNFMTGINNPRYWVHPLRKNFNMAKRLDFTETVYFGSGLKLAKGGSYTDKFYLSDLITKFRIIVNAYDVNGVIGYNQLLIQTQKPLQISFTLPTSFTIGDLITIPISVSNNLEKAQTYTFFSYIDSALTYTQPKTINVKAKSISTTSITVKAAQISELTSVYLGAQVKVNGEFIADSLRVLSKVLPTGFPREVNFGGAIGSNVFNVQNSISSSFNFTIPSTIIAGSAQYTLKIQSSTFATLLSAVQALIRDPYGCFEQTSATSYPMVMALGYLKALPQTPYIQGLQNQIEEKLKIAYEKLISFRVGDTGAYEWFGQQPPNEALSAYGLMQFTEMSEVTTLVDPGMVKKLKDWLLSRKLPNGSFNLTSEALDTFGRAPQNITDAYIVWALTEAGETIKVSDSLAALCTQADSAIANNNFDGYFLGLIASSLYNVGNISKARVYADAIVPYVNQISGNVTKSITTITSSDGSNRVIETTAIAVVAWMNEQSRYSSSITLAVNWLVSQVESGGQYGSTQATVLALKAIINYMENFASLNGDGLFVLSVNGKEAQNRTFTSDTKEAIQFDFAQIINNTEFTSAFKAGSNVKLTIALKNFKINSKETEDFIVQYAFAFDYYDTQPIGSSKLLGFTVQNLNGTALGKTSTNTKVIAYQFKLSNLDTTKGIGMTIAILRVPSCLSIQFNYLDQLVRTKKIAYYEVTNSNSQIVLYWRGIAAGGSITQTIPFIQKYSGTCLQKPHNAYLYYNDDQPVWVTTQ